MVRSMFVVPRTPRKLRTFGVCAVALVSVACAARSRGGPGAPDVSFRLEWIGTADLDLHVRSPLGEEIWYVDRRSRSGGALNNDCNVDPEDGCTEPLEIVSWPDGAAPEGTYEYWVRLMHPRETPLPVAYAVAVLRGGRAFRRHEGQLGRPVRRRTNGS